MRRMTSSSAAREPQEYFDCHVPHDFWEQGDNRKKLERQTALMLQSSKLNYQ